MLFENVSGRPDDAAPDAVSAAIPTRSFSSDSEKGPTTFSEAWRLAERAIRARVARACREHPRYCTVDDREELIQQARVVVWECLKTYRPTESKFATYAGAAIENMLCDFFARRRREAELVVDSCGSIESHANAVVRRHVLLRELAREPDGNLLLLNACGWRDRELGPANAIKKRRYRAARRVRGRLLSAGWFANRRSGEEQEV